MQDISSIVRISTNEGIQCRHCTTSIGLDKFEESVNHYIEQHGYRLLHVGMETSDSDVGSPWHSTVAVLGK